MRRRAIASRVLAAGALAALGGACDGERPTRASAAPGARPRAATDALDARRIEAHTRFLAGDLLGGRLPGTAGYDVAAEYVAAQLALLGLHPVAPEGAGRPRADAVSAFLHPVPLRRRSLAPDGVRLTLRGPGGPIALRNGVDAAVDASATDEDETIEAPLVFVGWGITAPSLGLDDYAELDVRGKAVVLLEGAPASLPGALRAHYSWIQEKERMAAARGAVAILTLKSPQRERVSPWARTRALRPRPWLSVARAATDATDGADGADGAAPAGDLPTTRATISLGPDAAAMLFARAGRDLAALYAGSERAAPRGFALPFTLALRRRSVHEAVPSANVVALLPGRDPALRGEHVVVLAHLDHVGVGAPVNGDSIHNGAVDNAGGVAVMLEAARALAAAPPRRPVLFVATTGEEQGLLGAERLAARPPVPLAQVAAAISVDGLMAFHDFTEIVALGAEHSTLGASSARAARAVGAVEVQDPQPERGNLALSDQYPFLRRGVPVLFPNPAPPDARDSVGRAAWDAYESTAYHRPSDDLALPLRWDVAARWTRYVTALVRDVAEAPTRPAWYADDPLAGVFAPQAPRAARPAR